MLQMPVAGARVDVVEDARDDMSRVATRFTTWVLLSREMDGEERRASHGSRPDQSLPKMSQPTRNTGLFPKTIVLITHACMAVSECVFSC